MLFLVLLLVAVLIVDDLARAKPVLPMRKLALGLIPRRRRPSPFVARKNA